MDTPTSHDVTIRLFPDMPEHAGVEILATKATVADLESVLRLLQDDGESQIEINRRSGDCFNQSIAVFPNAGIDVQADFEP